MSDRQDKFKMLLKQNGFKVTPQRVAILEVLSNRPDEHLTAEEIYECVKEMFPDIGLATVYRTIQVLSELKLIDKLNLDDGFIRYEIGKEKVMSSHHHHHLICLNCGQVLTVQDDLMERLESRIAETMDFEVVNHEVKLYGYCKDCKNKHKSED